VGLSSSGWKTLNIDAFELDVVFKLYGAYTRTALRSLGHAHIDIESPEDMAQAQLIVLVSCSPIDRVLQV